MPAIKQTNAIYLTIADGKICRRVQTKTPDAVERLTKDNKLVFEEFYKGWRGTITDIKTRENDYGKNWMIYLTDEFGDYILQLPYSSGYSASFLKALPNLDPSQPVTITPSLKIEGDKKRTSLFLNQNGVALKWAYTKDNPNGLPQLMQIKVKGKTTWDDSDIMEFLENMVNNEFLPKLNGNNPIENETDEIPF
jgi:predicted DNA-binding transcriptional regulator AlpA